MGRKTTFGVSFVGGYVVSRHIHKQAVASAAADDAAWQQAYAEMRDGAIRAEAAAAEAARDEVRHQAALTRRATWMSQDPVGPSLARRDRSGPCRRAARPPGRGKEPGLAPRLDAPVRERRARSGEAQQRPWPVARRRPAVGHRSAGDHRAPAIRGQRSRLALEPLAVHPRDAGRRR